jgi:hypothetical protein
MSIVFNNIWNNSVLTGVGLILTLILTLILLVINIIDMDRNPRDFDSQLMSELMGDQDVHK